jgi:hypothetical protein
MNFQNFANDPHVYFQCLGIPLIRVGAISMGTSTMAGKRQIVARNGLRVTDDAGRRRHHLSPLGHQKTNFEAQALFHYRKGPWDLYWLRAWR